MRAVIVVVFLFSIVPAAFAREAITPLGYGTPYREIKSHLHSAWDLANTAEKKRLLYQVGATRYGRRTTRALGPMLNLDPDLPGVRTLYERLTWNNKNVRVGAARAGRVAGFVNADPRFRVIALDEPVLDADGRLKTDRDIAYEHRPTGRTGRIEVKDVRRLGLRESKRQIDLMTDELRRTGQPQAFVNRRSVPPSLRAYAESRGVQVFENVSTSRPANVKGGDMTIAEVLDNLDRQHRTSWRPQWRNRLPGGALRGVGLWMAVGEGRTAAGEWGRVANGDGSWLKAGRHTASALSGTAAAFAGLGTAGRIAPLMRFAGPAAVGLIIVAEGFAVAEWHAGEVSTRQFVQSQAGLASGFAGGLAGAWAGAKIGAAIGVYGGPWGIAIGTGIGGVAGGIVGGYAASAATTYGVDRYYGSLDAEEKAELFKKLERHYAAQN